MIPTYCEIHGTTGSLNACKHVFVQVHSNNPVRKSLNQINSVTLVQLNITLYLGFPFRAAYCSKCAKQYHLPAGNISQLRLAFYVRKFQRRQTKIYFVCCLKCFYKKIFDKNRKENDPLLHLNQTSLINASF